MILLPATDHRIHIRVEFGRELQRPQLQRAGLRRRLPAAPAEGRQARSSQTHQQQTPSFQHSHVETVM